MNTKIIIAVVVFILLAALGIGLYVANGKKTSSSTNSKSNSQISAQPTQKSLSVSELFQKAMTSGSLKCTYSSENISGETFIKNGNVNFTATDTSSKKAIHSIIKNKIMWSWTEGETKGMMMDMSKFDTKVTPPQGAASPDDIQKQVEANRPNCTEENIPDSMFEVPKNITFTDLSKMMKSIPQISIPAGYKMPSGVPTQ